MLKFKDLNEREKNYWALIFLSKCIELTSDLTEKDFIIRVINFERSECLMGSDFLFATSDIYKSIFDLAYLLDFNVTINQLTREKIQEIKKDTFDIFENNFYKKCNLLDTLKDFYKIY